MPTNMKKQTFEDYLQDVHAGDYHGTDDDMPEAYELWLAEMDVQECIDHAEQFALIIQSHD